MDVFSSSLLKLVAFFGFAGLFLGPVTAMAGLGFEPAVSTAVPAEVRASAGKLFELWTPRVTAEMQASQYDAWRTYLQNSAPTDTDMRKRMRHVLNLHELDACVARQLPTCRLTKQAARGTAFVVPGNVLIATRHDFSQDGLGLVEKFTTLAANWKRVGAAAAAAEIEAFKRDPLHEALFILTDASGRVVLDSVTTPVTFRRYAGLTAPIQGYVDLDAGKAGLIGDALSEQGQNYSGAPWVYNDIVEIQLSVSLPGLAMASDGCAPGDAVFHAGYPVATTTRAALGLRDAVDRELSVSRGSILGGAQVLQRAQGWMNPSVLLQQSEGHPILMTDADVSSGMSGGPILNVQGQVCGMVKAWFPGTDQFTWNAAGFYNAFAFGVGL